MDRNELKATIDKVFNTNSIIDGTTEDNVVDVYTNVWFMDMAQLDELRSKSIQLQRIFVEGGKLALRIKL